MFVTQASPFSLAQHPLIELLCAFYHNVTWVQTAAVVAQGVHLIAPVGKKPQYRLLVVPQADSEAKERVPVSFALAGDAHFLVPLVVSHHPASFSFIVKVVDVEEICSPDESLEPRPQKFLIYTDQKVGGSAGLIVVGLLIIGNLEIVFRQRVVQNPVPETELLQWRDIVGSRSRLLWLVVNRARILCDWFRDDWLRILCSVVCQSLWAPMLVRSWPHTHMLAFNAASGESLRLSMPLCCTGLDDDPLGWPLLGG